MIIHNLVQIKKKKNIDQVVTLRTFIKFMYGETMKIKNLFFFDLFVYSF